MEKACISFLKKKSNCALCDELIRPNFYGPSMWTKLHTFEWFLERHCFFTQAVSTRFQRISSLSCESCSRRASCGCERWSRTSHTGTRRSGCACCRRPASFSSAWRASFGRAAWRSRSPSAPRSPATSRASRPEPPFSPPPACRRSLTRRLLHRRLRGQLRRNFCHSLPRCQSVIKSAGLGLEEFNWTTLTCILRLIFFLTHTFH